MCDMCDEDEVYDDLAPSAVVCDLQYETADRARAAVFVAEFLLWWHQAGKNFYGARRVDRDDGLIVFANDAVTVLGGWQAARRMLRAAGC